MAASCCCPVIKGIETILSDAARYLGRNYLFEHSSRKRASATINLQKGMELDATSCEEVTSQLALSVGLVMTPLDPVRGVYEFVDGTSSSSWGKMLARAVPMSAKDIEQRTALKICVRTTVELQHLSPSIAARNIERLLRGSRAAPFLAMPMGRGLVLVGLPHTVAQALTLLRATDVEGAQRVEADARLGEVEQRLERLDAKVEALARQRAK